MDHTLAVFVPEMSMQTGFSKSREEIARGANLFNGQVDEEKPLLLHMLEKCRTSNVVTNIKGQSPQTDKSSSPGAMQPAFYEQ